MVIALFNIADKWGLDMVDDRCPQYLLLVKEVFEGSWSEVMRDD